VPNTKKYPVSNLWTMVHELLRELKLDDQYTVLDVHSFGFNPDNIPSIWIEVVTRDAEGRRSGTEVITRFIEQDVKWSEWGQPPLYIPVLE
jgi:hypothetical protein